MRLGTGMDFKKMKKKLHKHLHQKVIFIGKSSDLKHSEWKNTPFLQPFTYMKINLNIIYMATDYSMYKARTSKLKLTSFIFYFFWRKATAPCEKSQEWTGEFGRNTDFNSAWKLSSNKDWLPTEYSCWQKYSTLVVFFLCFFVFTNSKCISKRELLNCTRLHLQRRLESQLHANTDILTWLVTSMLVTVYSDNLEQISVHVLTDIHHSGKQGRSVPLQGI